MNKEGAVLLLEGIYQRIRDDYKLLWYVKTHMQNGGEYIIRSSRYKGKKNNNPGIYMSGVSSTVDKEIHDIEDYIYRTCPVHAEVMIKHMRENCKDILYLSETSRRKIIA